MQGSLPRDDKGIIIDPKHSTDWIVPRRVMCAFFWIGIVLLFTGVILLVTGRHKGTVSNIYQSWGGILLGLGFCLLLICLILCLHAYCVITITEEKSRHRKNVPPPAPVMANGKKPYGRQLGPGQRKSAEPMNLLIMEKEDEPINSKSYNSTGSTSRGSNRDHRCLIDATGRHSYHRNGIIPNGPVTHPVTLVGTLTNNTASVSRGLSPLLEDDNHSISTAKDVFLGQNKISSLEMPSKIIQPQDSIAHVPILSNSMNNKSTSYSKYGMTIRSNPLDHPFPSEDIIKNVNNDARLIQNDLSSDKSESKVQNISGTNPTTNRKVNYDRDEIPELLYRSNRKMHNVDNRRHSGDHQNKSGKRPASISSVHNLPPESMNPQIKKFIDRVGYDPEIEDNENSDTKHLNISKLDQNCQTKTGRSESTKEKSNQGASSVATCVNDKRIPPNYSPKNITEPPYAKVNKDKTKTKIINTEEPTKAKIESIEKPKPQNAQIIPQQKNSESTENVAPPRSPNSLEFQRRMQKILEKQEMEKQRRSPRREKKSDQSPSPRSERQALCFQQHEQKTPSPQPPQQQELNQQHMTQQHMRAKQTHVENMQNSKSDSLQVQSKIQHSGMTNHSASSVSEHPFTATSDKSSISTDAGIYAKINPRKSSVLHKPQPVTYCKHCGSGHVTTVIPELPATIPEPVPNAAPPHSKENTFQSIDAIPSPLPTNSEAFATQYSWSDTLGTTANPGTTSTIISPTITSSEQFVQISSKPPLAPNISKMNQGIGQSCTVALPLPPSPAVARGKIAVTTAALLKQMHQEQLKVMQAQAHGGSQGGASGAGFDPSVALQQILLKQAVAHHHGRDIRRFSNPKVVYLGPDMEVTASKVSIYDNVQYVWKDDHDPN